MTNPEPAAERRALLQQALQALDEMQAKLDRVEQAAREPIAIIGLSCRFPGGATSPEAYWELLRAGRDVVRQYPAERRAKAEAGGVDVDLLGDSTAWYGGFLDEIDQFDPQFFGISPREAVTMDPQQRMVLEVSWEALERAGIAPDSLTGSATGVFVGITTNEYVQLAKAAGASQLDVYSATGGALNAAPGRVAYTLGLQGPCMAIDTACSSSLVALHQACQSLRTGESTMALAGGVNLLLLPEAFVCFERWGMMAPDGRCKTFDAAADGFVRGEGCGILVLKRLSDAVAAGDPVLAVIRGSAVNQDGRSSGLTVPNGPAQQAVLRQALAAAGVAPAAVQYFEAHGTGTTLGDPIEVEAMGAVLGPGRGADDPLVMGSVKTNLGHLESASGIAGVIKVVLSMQHGEIPAHLHFHERSPQIPWPAFPIVIPTETVPWPERAGRRVAGVSGFGFSGTNAHVVLESAPARPAAAVTTGPAVLALSARSDAALRALAGRYAAHLGAVGDGALGEVCATAATGRAQFPHRVAVVARTAAEMRAKLEAVAAGTDVTGVTAAVAGQPKVAFLFTGQGSQYEGMARGLYESEPVFRAALERAAAAVDGLGGGSLLDVVFAAEGSAAEGSLHRTGWTQPALFAVELALVELWRSWGVVPQAVLGHSVGELAAAVVAGVMSLEDGLRLVVARGRLMEGLPAGGAMATVFAPLADVEAVAAPLGVAVAAVNGPAHVVVSGEADAVASVVDAFAGRGVRTQALKVSHAFHSRLMAPILDDFGAVARSVTYRAPHTTLVTNVGGQVADAAVATAEHWVRHVSAPVDFARGIETLRGLGVDTFVEIGPHPVLLGMAQACVPAGSGTWIPSLRRGRDDAVQLRSALGSLYAHGARPDWAGVLPVDRRAGDVPTYPFERRRYWLDPVKPARRRTGGGGHPLLGRATVVAALDATVFEAEVGPDDPAWLADHRLADTVVFPGSGYIEMVLAAGDGVVESLSIHEAMVVPEPGTLTVETVVTSAGDGGREVQITSVDGGRSTLHARATIAPSSGRPGLAAIDPVTLAAGLPEEIDVARYYQRLDEIGLTYGPAFRGLTALRRRDGAALGLATLPPEVTDGGSYRLHPALLDSCFHVLGVAIASPASASDELFVPIGVSGLRLYRPGTTTIWCAVTILDGQSGDLTISARLDLYGTDGDVVATIDRFDVHRTSRAAWARRAGGPVSPVYELAWRPQEATAGDSGPGDWLIVADRGEVAGEVATRLTAAGGWCTVVPGPGNGTDPGTFRRVVEEALAPRSAPLGVVYLPALDAVVEPPDLHRFTADVEHILHGALVLAQCLADRVRLDARLWFVTRGGQAIAGETVAVAQASLWGLGRVIANEHPQLGARSIDLDPAVADPAGDLVRELRTAGVEDQVAHRDGERRVARLVRRHAGPAEMAPMRADGCYLVTGGLGGLGTAVARWLVERGARHLVLVGRRAPGPEAAAAIDTLRTEGADVSVQAADVADPAQLDGVLARIADAGIPLRGVFHAAGVVDDGALVQLSWSRFSSVLAPKLAGAWLLDQATRDLDLDHFVLFSSASGLLGAPGQSSYAAANRGLDAIAHHRRAGGRAGLSVDWGAWSGVGMAARLGEREQRRIAERGIHSLEPEAALRTLGSLLADGPVQVAVVAVDWATLLAQYPAGAAPVLFAELAAEPRSGRAADGSSAPSLASVLAGAEAQDRRGIVAAYVEDQIVRVLGLSAGEPVDRNQELPELGLDSLMAVELSNRLTAGTGLALPATLALEHPTIDAIAAHVAAALAGPAAEDGRRGGGLDRGPIVPVRHDQPIPGSSAQQRMLFIDQLAPGLAVFNLPLVLRLSGPLDGDAIEAAVAEVVRRHEALRTNFSLSESGYLQHIVDPDEVVVPFARRNLRDLDPSAADAALAAELSREVGGPFDLSRDPKLRAALIRTGSDEHVLVVTVHHIACDGWSMARLVAEITELYTARTQGREARLPTLQLQYADYSVWQHQLEQSDALAEQLQYWTNELDGVLPVLELPGDRSRPATRSYQSSSVRFDVAPEVFAKVRVASRSTGVTPFVFLLSVYVATLARWSGQDDFVVGTAAANRGRPETQDLIGLFVNTLAIRARVDLAQPFATLLEDVKQSVLGAFLHQDVPFNRVVDAINPPRDPSRSIVFQTMFVLHNMPLPELDIPGLDVQPIEMSAGASEYDLSVFIAETGDRASVSVDFNTDVFDAATIERLMRHWSLSLAAAAEDPTTPAGALPLLSSDESDVLVREWGAPGPDILTDWPEGVTRLDHFLSERVRQIPDAVAVEHLGEVLSYRELDERTNQFARRLLLAGVVPGDRVGVAVERSTSMFVSLLAVLRCGAAYVPLDPAFPAERLTFTVADAGVDVVVVSSGTLTAHLDLVELTTIDIVGEWAEISTLDPGPLAIDASEAPGGGVAYVIYTSGSTGLPKGVVIEHSSVISFVLSMLREPGFTADDVVLGITTLSFDPSILELFVPLAAGGRVVIASREDAMDGRRLGALIASSRATVVQATPTTWSMLFDAGWSGAAGLKALCGGEAMSVDLGRRLLASCTSVWNVFGPTETTVWATVHRVDPSSLERVNVPIGRPIARTVCRVLDANGTLTPIGVPGELFIGGAGVARGYRNRPELTKERFIADPFAPGERLYRTGDLARWRPDGTLEYLGRLDFQVKIRGHRIELGEIESALRAHPGINDAVAIADPDAPSGRLLAYVIPVDADGVLTAGDLRSWLQQKLPDYMIPALFIPIDAFPTTPTRKVDRKALPRPDITAVARAEYVAPSNDVEEVVAGIFAETLGIERAGVTDSLFDLGGHSLHATSLLSKIETVFGVTVDLRTFFVDPTVAATAAALSSLSGGSERRPIVPVGRGGAILGSSAQQRMLFIDQFAPGLAVFNLPVVVRLSGSLDVGALVEAVEEVVCRHEALRTNFAFTDDGWLQVVVDAGAATVVVERVELPGASAEEVRAQVQRLVSRPFDLGRDLKLRVALIRTGPDEHVLVMTVHHIASDGWSMVRLVAEVVEGYTARQEGRPAVLPRLPVQYVDYSVWQRQQEESAELAAQLEYWGATLGGTLPVLELPGDRPRPAVRSYQSGVVRFDLPVETMGMVRAASRTTRVTPFVFFLSAYMATLARWSGQDDFVVGTAAANRSRPEVQDLVGLFVNTLAIRARVDLAQPFTTLLEDVKQAALGAFLHQDVPFNRVVDAIKPPRDVTRSIVFQTMFVLNNMALPDLEVPGLEVTPMAVLAGASEYDLAVFVTEAGDRVNVGVEFNADVFDAATIERLMGHWRLLLSAAAEDPAMPAGGLARLPADEREVLLREWGVSGVRVDWPSGVARLDELVTLRARRGPDAVAVEANGEVLTYRQLDERANQLARRLVAAGVGPGDRVGVAVERSTSMLVALLAVLKCGAAYVPLDPGFPPDRLAFMVADAGVAVVLVSPGSLTGRVNPAGVTVIDVVAEWGEISMLEAGPLGVDTADAPGGGVAYVIYTSGSTGLPKGVEIEHQSVINFVLSMIRDPGFTADDVLVAVTTLSFDISVLELFVPLAAGGRVVIASRDDAMDGRRLAALIGSSGATVMQATPTTWSMLFEAGWSGAAGLKVLCGGEAMPVELGRRLIESGGSLWNMFGPTETTIWSTVHRVGPASLEHVNVPIGRPIASTVCRVLDANGALVPIGVPGELFLGGAGVARGYLNRDELTEERFIADPFAPEGRLYRTGDLARWLPDGNLEYLGRLDLQVKVRGYRIELGEIESALRAHGGVTDAVVVPDPDAGSDRLLAYVIPVDADAVPTAGDLRSCLQQRLPDYMIPSLFLAIDAFPTTPNRKIDRKALPRPDRFAVATAEHVAPRNEVEQVLAGLFAETLGIERAGVTDSLFDLGGHSLHATSLLAKIETVFGVSLELRTLFVDPSVAATATNLTADPGTRHRIERVAQLRVKLDAMSPEEVAAMLAARRAGEVSL